MIPLKGSGRKDMGEEEQSLVLLLFTRNFGKRLLPILTLGFLLGEIFAKSGHFFFSFFCFFFVENGDFKKKSVSQVFWSPDFKKEILISIFL